jgi:hypothetical protein
MIIKQYDGKNTGENPDIFCGFMKMDDLYLA